MSTDKTTSNAGSPTSDSYPSMSFDRDLEDWSDLVEEGREKIDNEWDSENDELGDLVTSQDPDVMASLYGTSMPKSSFFESMSNRGSPRSPLTSLKKGSLGLASPRSFRTAQSSLASYTTASSVSHSTWQMDAMRAERQIKTVSRAHDEQFKTITQAYDELINTILAGSLTQLATSMTEQEQTQSKRKDIIRKGLLPLKRMTEESVPMSRRSKEVKVLVDDIIDQLIEVSTSMILDLGEESLRSMLRKDISTSITDFFDRYNTSNVAIPDPVFSTEWLKHLHGRGILLSPLEEFDWSGRGQHIEYSPDEEEDIPLKYERTLGHSQTAVVDSVRCRRILLARKKITCNRRLKKEDAIVEVEHLQRLQHLHVVRVVGTYTFKKELAILVYPATEWDLDKYMDDLCDDAQRGSELKLRAKSLIIFLGCLSNAIYFIHSQKVKHMDIKPKNLLVRLRYGNSYRIYVADFGIARAYTSAADAETDSPTSFTRTYAAPEVVHQDTRGFSADIFSLGCVFMEMMATLSSCFRIDGAHDGRQRLLDVRKAASANSSFYANIGVVRQWYYGLVEHYAFAPSWDLHPDKIPKEMLDMIPRMISKTSTSRPTASTLIAIAAVLRCIDCDMGPEPFEAAN
ncbi:kinase-like protein [Ophiobolus disseminans]|uniref:Kinase-like protein n=1 Tax=Ophiobolus disseminans TaxID=1469910 RepID=A0A6A6ZUE8_9PLEO|nr:kinase-like protein [Ophiobolus disseminans]